MGESDVTMATDQTDTVWSWVIAAACCWVTFVVQGLVRSGGVVYVALIDAYGVNRALASWPFTLRMAVWNLSGPLAGALSYRFSIRCIALCGVMMVTVTNVICWFASDIYVVIIFLGGIQGLGVGLAVTLVPVIINQYFRKYKSSGAGLACAGATAGSFALPPLVEFAVEEFGLQGAFLLTAGITLHGVIGAALMRPAEWLKNPATKNNAKKEDQNLNLITEPEEAKNLLNGGYNRTSPRSNNKTVRFTELAPPPDHPHQEQEDSSLLAPEEATHKLIESHHPYDPQINIQPVYMATTVPNPPSPPPSILKQVPAAPGPLKAAAQILRNPMFLVIASNYSIFFLSYMTYLIVIVDHSLDLGIERGDCVFLVSAFSMADLCGRLGSGWVTDGGIVQRKHLMVGNMLAFGGLLVATSFCTTYVQVTAVSVSAGLVVGVNLIIFYALLEEYLGLRQLPMAIGLMNFSIGIVSLVTPLLTGYFRDTMGSYDHLFHLLGGVSILCALLWVVEPIYMRCNKREKEISPVYDTACC